MLMPSIYGNNFVDSFFNDFPFFDRDMKKAEHKLYGSKAEHIMSTDIQEHENGYKLDMDLPGFGKDDIKISLDQGYLIIEAAKNIEQDESDKKDSKYIRKERYSGSCRRSFYVGDALTEEDIKASFDKGILTLDIPKKDAKAVPEKKYIAIDG